MGRKEVSAKSQPAIASDVANLRAMLTPFYMQQAAKESPWYTPLASAYSNVLGAAAQKNQYQLPQDTLNMLSQAASTGFPYQGDITQSPIYKGAQKGYQEFVEPALADIREQQSTLGALRTADTQRLQAESVGRIGSEMMTSIIPQILQEYSRQIGTQMQAAPLLEQAQMYPAQFVGSMAQIGAQLPASQYPWLPLATQYAESGMGQSQEQYIWPQQIQGGINCCFIMLEAGDLTDKVRFFRDKYFSKDHPVAIGYKRMAKWLVPLMRKHKVLKLVVKYTMTHPIALWAENQNWFLHRVANFWVRVWRIYGYGSVASS